ncbi:MAG TPA: SusC/RagA family TonB-linked outer membrane protein, partial [Flavisolibacter sp.]|nr:SusC/RagA family TonB-linked outer membrane protein [Flavisolibacter sp.]
SSQQLQMNEVVVTAYGIRKNKRELSYQAPVVKGEDIAQTRRENFVNALAGRVPGLTVTSTSGVPGAGAQVVLRGPVSIAGNNQPLFVIDGVPASNNSFNQTAGLVNPSNLASTPASAGFASRGSDYTNRIADINPEDIESVTILKGPEATALFGSDGASGAIIITTKRGTAGRTTVSYDNSFATQKVYRFPEIQTEYSRGTNGIYDPQAYSTTYGFLMFGPKYSQGTQLYDNLHSFFQPGFSQQHNLSLESGTQAMTYRLSAGYLDQKGVVPNTGYKRINFRLSGSAKISEKISAFSTWSYTNSDNDKASKGPGAYYNNLITWPLDANIQNWIDATGKRVLLRNATGGNAGELDNPFWDVYKNTSNDKTDRLLGNVTFNYNPNSWLAFSGILGIDHYITDGNYYLNPQSYYGSPINGLVSTYTDNFRNLNGTVRGTINKTFANKYSNSLTVGFYAEDNKTNTNSQRGERFYEPDFYSINNTDPTSQAAKLNVRNIRKSRFFGTYTFGYNNIAFLNLGGSYEGVSTLTSAFFDKFPFFAYGSVSGSFIFSDLDGFKAALPFISYGKLRASYATTGKGPGNPYIIDSRFVPSIYTGGGFYYDVIGGNASLRPEFSRNMEVGTELQFLKGRISLDFAYYKIQSEDQIVSNRLSYGTGYVIKYINGGVVENKGFEVQLKTIPLRKQNFKWDLTVNFDRNRGVIKKMPADLPFYYDSDTWLFGNIRSQVSPGSSIANLSGIKLQRNSNGQLLISPTTGLPIKGTDYVPIGDRTPDFKMGVINSFTFFNNLDFSFNLDIRKGGDVFNGNEMMMTITGVSKKTLDREQPRVIEGVLKDGLEETAHPTKNTIVINPYYRNDFYSAAYTEADFIESVNWLRLRDMTLSYHLPNTWLKKQSFIKQASVFLTGTDLF